MINVVGGHDDLSKWKPHPFEDYYTLGEVAKLVCRDKNRIIVLEKQGRLPNPIRVKVGRHQVRLYDDKQVAKIEKHFKNAKPGRPTKKRV